MKKLTRQDIVCRSSLIIVFIILSNRLKWLVKQSFTIWRNLKYFSLISVRSILYMDLRNFGDYHVFCPSFLLLINVYITVIDNGLRSISNLMPVSVSLRSLNICDQVNRNKFYFYHFIKCSCDWLGDNKNGKPFTAEFERTLSSSEFYF